MNKKFGLYGLLIGFYYVVQFCMCVGCCNFYSDISRYNICQRLDGSYIQGENASKVYDRSLYLVGIFHIIEWIRTTILLCCICIGVNLMQVWYLSTANLVFGLVCLVYVHIGYAGSDGMACAGP